jgi:hypothetical protein
MKAAVKKNAYIFSFFVIFLIFIGFILFIVLFESGIIQLYKQPVSVSSFSCTPSGTVINVYKGVEQPVNLTNVILTVGKVEHSLLNSNIEIKGKAGYYSFDFPYSCVLDNEALQASVYYESYSSSSKSFNAGNNFFSSLISDTKV